MHKKGGRISLSMHSYEARPKALTEYTEKENASPYGRISTHMPFGYENLDVFRRNDLLALMLNHLVTPLWQAAVLSKPPYRCV